MLKYFSVTPPENSGGAVNSTENSGPHAKNFFCSMYESSLRHPVWVPEINVKPCNSVAIPLTELHPFVNKLFLYTIKGSDQSETKWVGKLANDGY